MSDPSSNFADIYTERVRGPNPIVALLYRYLPGRRALFAVAVAAATLQRLGNLVPPYLLGLTVDVILGRTRGTISLPLIRSAWLPGTRVEQFEVLLGLFAAVAAITVVLAAITTLTWRWLRDAVLHDLRVDAFDASQRLDVAFYERERTGDVMSVLNNDVNQLESFVGGGLRDLLQLSVRFVGLLAVMFWLHWQLTLLVLVLGPVMVGVVALEQRLLEPRYDDRRSAVGTLNANLQNVLGGIQTVKAFANEDHERTRLRDNSRAYWRADWAAAKLNGLFGPTRNLVANAAMLVVVGVGGWWAAFGTPLELTAPLSTGTFVTFYFYGQMFVAQSQRLAGVVEGYTDAKASAKRVFGLLEHPATEGTDEDAKPVRDVGGAVTFEDVTMTYPDADEPVLRDVGFAVDEGDTVGVVGPTGAGKSTLVKLLMRFYDPDDGRVYLDGHDLSGLDRQELRRHIGYVGQEPFLFDRTIRENIAYGDLDAGNEAIERSARLANAHEFVTELPDGYDTQVGERGVKLSGGQRQRLAMARSLLRDPSVLILDEATSHVDTLTELLVQESLDDVLRERTTFVIAHRLATVRDADTILVLEDGEVVERGTHDELVAADGLYASLWRVHQGSREDVPERFTEPDTVNM